MVIVHYIPGFFFANLSPTFQLTEFCQLVADFPTRRVGESLTLRLAEFSFKQSKDDYPTWGVGVSFFD
jgi:hypothetical protein